MTKERPILFSGPMVRAILDGRKTQTRRAIKRYNIYGPNPPGGIWDWRDTNKNNMWIGAHGGDLKFKDTSAARFCPYGKSGDKLWVRETWADPNDQVVIYRANWREDAMLRGLDNIPLTDQDIKWRPSIHMPRWASRIKLEISSIRVERLQEISEDDAFAEGVQLPVCKNDDGTTSRLIPVTRKYVPKTHTAKEFYASLWEEINGKGAWAQNPWVWVVEFRRED
ncbi:MAG: hypothetical protein WAO98_10810 [Alphaproteobacteria bacterium]